MENLNCKLHIGKKFIENYELDMRLEHNFPMSPMGKIFKHQFIFKHKKISDKWIILDKEQTEAYAKQKYPLEKAVAKKEAEL